MSKKSVTFNPIETVHITYSAEEYDRSRYASMPITSFTFRPLIIQTPPSNHNIRPVIKPLDLSMIPNSRRRALPFDNTSCKRPKLSIDTQSLTPLFFSGLSTHYTLEEEDGYLIPLSAAC
jgi:hypothetical protein